MRTKNIQIEPDHLATNTSYRYNIPTNKVWWYYDNKLKYVRQYRGSWVI